MPETPLARAIPKEREAAQKYYMDDALITPYNAARAATDEAVKAVEAAMRAAFRLLTGGDALSDAEWRWCTDTVAAYVRGDTTGGDTTPIGEGGTLTTTGGASDE